MLFNFHMGTASTPDSPGSDGESIRYVTADKAVVETGPGGGVMVYVPLVGRRRRRLPGRLRKVQGRAWT